MVFVVGSSSGSSNDYQSTELMNTSTLKWATKKQYPYKTWIYAARSLFYRDQFITFGGVPSRNRIAAYNPKTDDWSTLGAMKTKRSYTSVIQIKDEFLIVGGYHIDGSSSSNSSRSERCRFKGTKLKCQLQSPSMLAGGNFINSKLILSKLF